MPALRINAAADMLGVSPSTLRGWERGQGAAPAGAQNGRLAAGPRGRARARLPVGDGVAARRPAARRGGDAPGGRAAARLRLAARARGRVRPSPPTVPAPR